MMKIKKEVNMAILLVSIIIIGGLLVGYDSNSGDFLKGIWVVKCGDGIVTTWFFDGSLTIVNAVDSYRPDYELQEK